MRPTNSVRSIRRMLSASAAAGVLMAALTACGGGGDSDAQDSQTNSTADQTSASASATGSATSSDSQTSTEATSAATPAATGSTDLTPGGTQLAIGDTAVVPAGDGSDKYVLELTVTGIDKGTAADLKSLGLDGDSQVPYYVKLTAKVVSGNAEGGDPSEGLVALAGDTPAQQIIEFGDFKPCNLELFETGTVGTTLQTCDPFVAAKGDTVDSVAFTGGDGDPIVWK